MHFEDAPQLRKLVVDILNQQELEGPIVAKDVDAGKTIGNSDVVGVDDTDEVVYAIRKQREDQGYVPFTKSRAVEPSSFISFYLVEKDDTTHELLSTWIGEFESPPFPQMENATADSVPYWSKHAFVWGSQGIIPETEVSDCPW